MPYSLPYFTKTGPIGNPVAGEESQQGPALAETSSGSWKEKGPRQGGMVRRLLEPFHIHLRD